MKSIIIIQHDAILAFVHWHDCHPMFGISIQLKAQPGWSKASATNLAITLIFNPSPPCQDITILSVLVTKLLHQLGPLPHLLEAHVLISMVRRAHYLTCIGFLSHHYPLIRNQRCSIHWIMHTLMRLLPIFGPLWQSLAWVSLLLISPLLHFILPTM